MVPVAGVDGCRGGWVVVAAGRAAVCPSFASVLAALPGDAVIAVDIPIGLLDGYVRGGRRADTQARALLPGKKSSVFPAPARCCFGARSLDDARRHGCRITLQGLGILPKVEDVDRVMAPHLQSRVLEVHPELSFRAMNDDIVVTSRKQHRAARDERRALLEQAGVTVPERPRAGEDEGDLLDACAALWSARRIAAGVAGRVPAHPPYDRRGLRMEICW